MKAYLEQHDPGFNERIEQFESQAAQAAASAKGSAAASQEAANKILALLAEAGSNQLESGFVVLDGKWSETKDVKTCTVAKEKAVEFASVHSRVPQVFLSRAFSAVCGSK